MLNSSGSIRVRAYTAGGALPVSGAIVRITGAEEDNNHIAYTLMTDTDGLTPEVALPAPSVEYSLNSNPAEQPYSIYNMEVSASGFYTKKILGMTVFPGVTSIQLVNMIPNSGTGQNEYPRGNINSSIPENKI